MTEPETEPTTNGTKRTRKRPRISYADRCREMEGGKAAQQCKLAMVLTLLRKVGVDDGSAITLDAAKELVSEMIE